MAVSPGAAGKVNGMKGIVCLGRITEQNISEHGNVILSGAPDSLYFLDDGRIVVNDGTTPLSNIKSKVIVDQVLVKAEKDALAAAFSSGAYQAAANGVVVHGADGKIDDASLKVVTDGAITDSYLSKFWDGSKLKIDALPDVAKGHVTWLPTYVDLDSATDDQKKTIVIVLDATGDSTVEKGCAMYLWDGTNSKWIKMSEPGELDFDMDSIRPSYENVQASGAIMYDHMLVTKSPDVNELLTISGATSEAGA